MNKEKKTKKTESNELQTQLEECQKKCEEYLNNWKRERADFINYKKDEIERNGFLGKYVKEDIFFKILPILDNIYLAESHIPEEFKEHQWTEGFSQIKNQLIEFLKKEGIEEIKTEGQVFDPNLMEAMEATEEIRGGRVSTESGLVVEEIQKGYTMDNKVIRPAKVRVTK